MLINLADCLLPQGWKGGNHTPRSISVAPTSREEDKCLIVPKCEVMSSSGIWKDWLSIIDWLTLIKNEFCCESLKQILFQNKKHLSHELLLFMGKNWIWLRKIYISAIHIVCNSQKINLTSSPSRIKPVWILHHISNRVADGFTPKSGQDWWLIPPETEAGFSRINLILGKTILGEVIGRSL